MMADVQDDMLDLAGCWQVATVDGRHPTTISIPGDVHSALEQAGIIPDPYAGRNEELVQWVAHEDWVLEREFELSDASGCWYLDIDYLDTVATVFVNDIEVLSADNCFRRFRPDVSKALKIGPNSLRIVIHSSIRAGAERQAAQPFYVPYSTGNSPIPNGNMLRKPQCHFGWDWNIALAPLGLYGTIALKRLDDARIEHVTTRQHHNGDGSVDVEVTVTLHAADPCIVPLHLAFGDEALRFDCGLRPGENTVTHLFHLDAPRLWWPVGSGEQVLYMLSVEVPSERIVRRIGLRQVELLTTPDAAGSRFALRVNGREIFCRGANWIPADALFSRSSPERTEALLQSAVDAHMNMIRVWGGGFYEHDWFYDLCDRMGLMVWQDFMFACNLYPCTEDFLENVAHEVEYQVKRLSSHPSITLWCGDNELVGALTWFEESRNNRDRYLVAYDRLNRVIEQQMKKAAPDGIWWPSSPASGYLDYGDAWHADGSGDMHYWSVWHENKSFGEYRSVRPRFCSEFGFQSYTSLPVIRTFAGEGDLNIASPVMELHQKNVGGNERIAGTMFRYFRFPTSFAGFVYLSQVQQALAIRTAVDYWRSLKPHCMGTLYWQLNDTWPVASWASLDYGGRWKAMHYLARRFFQPVTLAVIPEGEAFAVSAVNDTAEAVEIEAEFFLLSLAGERTPLHRLSGPSSPDRAEKLFEIPRGEVPPQSVLAWRFTAANGMASEGHIVPDTYKALDLKPSGLTHSVTAAEDGQWDIAIEAGGLALFVMIESETDGRYADNLFDLAGGESRRIRFTPTAALPPGAVPQFRVTDLHLAQA
ncbi:MAG: glycoside hydrolase family 2 protein [Rhizobiales bacterium]|nr:glycoside hydrolase family 2 protein [Hyphomicrobiales bacterium]